MELREEIVSWQQIFSLYMCYVLDDVTAFGSLANHELSKPFLGNNISRQTYKLACYGRCIHYRVSRTNERRRRIRKKLPLLAETDT